MCYTRELGLCRGFIVQCELIFEQQPRLYATNRARIAFVVSSLGGRALEWATGPVGYHYETFTTKFRAAFDPSHWLFTLQQEGRSVAEYAIEFHTLAEEVGWNEAALRDMFYHGLEDQLKDKLAVRGESGPLTEYIALDNCMRER